MKRTLLAFCVTLLTATALPAQDLTPASIEAANRQALSTHAARVTVVATRKVPRHDFPLWYGHLTDGSWAPDDNWYPDETTDLYISRMGADSTRKLVHSIPLDTIWSRPEPICGPNAPGNQLYPMRSPDGQRLYFAADSLFGMGGYDLYVATWDPRKKAWGDIQNMGLPFNSPGDDLLFCETPDGRYALFASNRDCGPDEIIIYVLRQEVPVQESVTPEEAATRLHLAVTAPDNGYPFTKQALGQTPRIRFDEPEPIVEAPKPAKNAKGKNAKKTPASKKTTKKSSKKDPPVKIVNEEFKIVK